MTLLGATRERLVGAQLGGESRLPAAPSMMCKNIMATRMQGASGVNRPLLDEVLHIALVDLGHVHVDMRSVQIRGEVFLHVQPLR